ncbi:unnamed protein product, partial [Prorocentrum cordatum]
MQRRHNVDGTLAKLQTIVRVAQRQSLLDALPQNQGMAALLARMQAREAAAQGRERAQRESERLRKGLPRPPVLALEELEAGRRFRAELVGPEGSPFESCRFNVAVDIGDEYPFKPPGVRFLSPRRVFHPNIDPSSGGICLDILNDATLWSPAIGLEKLLVGIVSL